jgi:hypothetical protein
MALISSKDELISASIPFHLDPPARQSIMSLREREKSMSKTQNSKTPRGQIFSKKRRSKGIDNQTRNHFVHDHHSIPLDH